jgi:HEAT repeat protein
MEGNYSDEIKERALFVLSQIHEPEAQELIFSMARNGSGDLRDEAIRMIGIGGDPEALAQLAPLYRDGDRDVRDAVLEAYIIADDEDAAYALAVDAQDPQAFAQAVEALGVMGAHEKLRQLRDHATLSGSEASEALIEAYAISGDLESLTAFALDTSDSNRQMQAIEGLGIIGNEAADTTLAEIFRTADNRKVKESAVEGLMISGNDTMLFEMYRSSDNAADKRLLLEYLVMMGSDDVWQVIDQALEGND